MPRRTKQASLATRDAILDAAEHLFQQRGVSATSLQDVAHAAGVTRGAVYWHFRDKTEVFDAMLARVLLRLDEAAAAPLQGDGPALPRLRTHLASLFAWIEHDAQAARVFDVVTTRVEYVDRLSGLRARQTASCRAFVQQLQAVLADAQVRHELPPSAPAADAAVALFALVDGLIRNWVLDRTAYSLSAVGPAAVDRLLAGYGAVPG